MTWMQQFFMWSGAFIWTVWLSLFVYAVVIGVAASYRRHVRRRAELRRWYG